MMTVYRIAPDNQIGEIKISDLVIEAIKGTQAIPVGHVHVIDHDFPFDKRQLIENLVDILNQSKPRHNIDGGDDKIFYQRNERGIVVNWQKQGAGISKPGLVVTVNEGSL